MKSVTTKFNTHFVFGALSLLSFSNLSFGQTPRDPVSCESGIPLDQFTSKTQGNPEHDEVQLDHINLSGTLGPNAGFLVFATQSLAFDLPIGQNIKAYRVTMNPPSVTQPSVPMPSSNFTIGQIRATRMQTDTGLIRNILALDGTHQMLVNGSAGTHSVRIVDDNGNQIAERNNWRDGLGISQGISIFNLRQLFVENSSGFRVTKIVTGPFRAPNNGPVQVHVCNDAQIQESTKNLLCGSTQFVSLQISSGSWQYHPNGTLVQPRHFHAYMYGSELRILMDSGTNNYDRLREFRINSTSISAVESNYFPIYSYEPASGFVGLSHARRRDISVSGNGDVYFNYQTPTFITQPVNSWNKMIARIGFGQAAVGEAHYHTNNTILFSRQTVAADSQGAIVPNLAQGVVETVMDQNPPGQTNLDNMFAVSAKINTANNSLRSLFLVKDLVFGFTLDPLNQSRTYTAAVDSWYQGAYRWTTKAVKASPSGANNTTIYLGFCAP